MTGTSWTALRNHIAHHHPDSLFIENLPSLLQTVPEPEQSDADFVVQELHGLGYGTVVMQIVDAHRYGSTAARSRLIWLCLLGPDNGRSTLIAHMLHEMILPDEPAWESYMLPAVLRVQDTLSPGLSYEGDDTKSYKEDHMNLYDRARLPWPAPRQGSMALSDLNHFGQRAYETAFYVHHVFPSIRWGVPEFIDVNSSLPRLALDGERSRSPWRSSRLHA